MLMMGRGQCTIKLQSQFMGLGWNSLLPYYIPLPCPHHTNTHTQQIVAGCMQLPRLAKQQ